MPCLCLISGSNDAVAIEGTQFEPVVTPQLEVSALAAPQRKPKKASKGSMTLTEDPTSLMVSARSEGCRYSFMKRPAPSVLDESNSRKKVSMNKVVSVAARDAIDDLEAAKKTTTMSAAAVAKTQSTKDVANACKEVVHEPPNHHDSGPASQTRGSKKTAGKKGQQEGETDTNGPARATRSRAKA